MTRRFENTWTEERIEQLKKLWFANVARIRIEEIMKLSKGTIIGKARRLNLPARDLKGNPTLKKATAKPLKIRNERTPLPDKPDFRKYIPAKPTHKPGACQWPIGTPGVDGFYFCGEDTDGKRSYCDHHCDVAYIKGKN